MSRNEEEGASRPPASKKRQREMTMDEASDEEFEVVSSGSSREIELSSTHASGDAPPLAKRAVESRRLLHKVGNLMCLARVIVSNLKCIEHSLAVFPAVLSSSQPEIVVTCERSESDPSKGTLVMRSHGPSLPKAINRIDVTYADSEFPHPDLPPSVFLNGLHFVTMFRSYVNDAVSTGIHRTIIIFTETRVWFMHPPEQNTDTPGLSSPPVECMRPSSIIHNVAPSDLVIPSFELPVPVHMNDRQFCLTPPPAFMEASVDLAQYFPIENISQALMRAMKSWKTTLKVVSGGDPSDKGGKINKNAIVLLNVEHVLPDDIEETPQTSDSPAQAGASKSADKSANSDVECEERLLFMLMSGNAGQTGNQQSYIQTMSFSKSTMPDRWKSARPCFMHDLINGKLSAAEQQTSGPSDIHCCGVNFSQLFNVVSPAKKTSGACIIRLLLPRGDETSLVRLQIKPPLAASDSTNDEDHYQYRMDVYFNVSFIDEHTTRDLDTCTRDTYDAIRMCPTLDMPSYGVNGENGNPVDVDKVLVSFSMDD